MRETKPSAKDIKVSRMFERKRERRVQAALYYYYAKAAGFYFAYAAPQHPQLNA